MRYKTQPLFRAVVICTRLLGCHLLPERQNCNALLQSQNSPAAAAIFRTTRWLAHAGLAILGPGPVAAGNQSAFVFQAPFVMQELAFGAHITIFLGLKNESARGQAMRRGSPAARIFTGHAAQKIHLSFRHFLDNGSRRVTPIPNNLLGLLPL